MELREQKSQGQNQPAAIQDLPTASGRQIQDEPTKAEFSLQMYRFRDGEPLF